MSTDQRIREDAKSAWRNTITAYEDSDETPFWEGYYTGAKSERNKVLEELLQKLDRGYKDYVWYKHLRAEIDSLKVNP